jgi:phosphinothricin acetyltransferase
MNIQIRIAVDDDVEAITEIYNQAVQSRSATGDLRPVSVESRRAWLKTHDASTYPIFVAENGGNILGWCSLSPYRPGRMALRHTAEISYYIHEDYRRQGIASRLISHAVERGPSLGLKALFAILLDINTSSVGTLEKLGFRKWGHMPNVADFDGRECGHFYYGLHVDA